MKQKQNHRFVNQSCLTLLLAALVLPGFAQEPTAAERVANLKAIMAASQAALRQYEWIETTVVTLKGEEKFRKQERCYYGADGGLAKTQLSATPPPERRRGLLGRIAEHERAEVKDYMEQAFALMKNYVPPKPDKIQAAKDAGKISVTIVDPGKRVRVNLADFYKPGDSLGAEIGLTNNRLLGVTVKSYMEDAQDAVDLQTNYATLDDGTSYVKTITLSAPREQVQVAVENSGYRKTGN